MGWSRFTTSAERWRRRLFRCRWKRLWCHRSNMLKKNPFAGLLFLAAALHAAPTIRDIQPRGAQRGKTFTLYVRGDGLTQGAQIRSTLPASFSQLTLSKDPLSDMGAARPGAVLPYLVALKADTPIGFYPICVSTVDGISNVVLFSVGDLPEVEEIE